MEVVVVILIKVVLITQKLIPLKRKYIISFQPYCYFMEAIQLCYIISIYIYT
jgi:hypothetical protein